MQIERLQLFFLSTITIMCVIFWNEDNFGIIFDCKKSFKGKLKETSQISKNISMTLKCTVFIWRIPKDKSIDT